MNTSRFTIDDEHIIVHHNTDWSGDAIVMWGRIETPRHLVGDERYPFPDSLVTYAHEVKLPGALLLALGREAALNSIRSKLISVLENL